MRMRLLKKARQRFQDIMATMKRPDRAIIQAVVPRKTPTLAQLQHIDLFLDTWEKNLIGALGFVAIISLIGIIWSIKIFNTVPGPAQGGSLTEVLIGTPRHINPIFAVTDTDRTLSHILFLPLCDSFNENVPALATCEFASTQKSVGITLSDRTWHDGEPVTADDVVFTLQTMQNTAVGSPWRALATRVTVTKDSTNHITISARQPIPELKTVASLGIVPKHVWASVEPARMVNDEANLKPIGSGPFEFHSNSLDRDGFVEQIDLDAFPDFKPQRAYLDELDFRIAQDDASAHDMFRTRQVDALFVHDPAETEELVKRDVRRYEIAPPAVVSLFFNPTHNAVFKKRDVRQAFARALDRTELVKQVLKGNGTPTRSPFPASMIKEPGATQPDVDTAQAATLFKANPVTPTTSSTLILGIPALPIYQAIADDIKKQLAPLGVNLTSAIIGSGTKTGAMLSYDMLLLGQDYGPSGNPFPFWHTSTSGETGTNYARYQIKEVDGWLEQLQVDGRPDSRASLLEKLNARLVADSPAIFLFQPTYQYYVSNTVKNVSVPQSGDPSERFATVASWYSNTKRVHK